MSACCSSCETGHSCSSGEHSHAVLTTPPDPQHPYDSIVAVYDYLPKLFGDVGIDIDAEVVDKDALAALTQVLSVHNITPAFKGDHISSHDLQKLILLAYVNGFKKPVTTTKPKKRVPFPSFSRKASFVPYRPYNRSSRGHKQ